MTADTARLKRCYCCREAGAVSSLVALLQPGQELPSDLLKAVLKVLLGLAHDQASCEAVQKASGIPRIIKLLEYAKDEQVGLLLAHSHLLSLGHDKSHQLTDTKDFGN